MTKNEITKRMADSLGLTKQIARDYQKETNDTIRLFLYTMVEALDEGETIYLRGLGAFWKQVSERECSLNIHNSEKGIVRKNFTFAKIRFKTGKTLRKRLKKVTI